jgi:hypothetical protein
LGDTEVDRQLCAWRGELRDGHLFELPKDDAMPKASHCDADTVSAELSPEGDIALRRLAQRENVTLFMVLLAGFLVFVHRTTKQDDIILTSPAANRIHAATEVLIGPFANKLVLRTDCSGNPTFRELLGRVREAHLAAHAHCDVPFEMLVADAESRGYEPHSPLFQVLFSLRNSPKGTLKLGASHIREVEFVRALTEFGLECHVVDGGTQLMVQMVFNTELYRKGSVDRFLHHYVSVLKATIANPEQRISLTLAQAEVSQIWGDLLHVKCVGIDEDFFQLGGHSLLVTQMLSRVRDRIGVDVPVWKVLESPTISAVAENIELAQRSVQLRSRPGITRRSKL